MREITANMVRKPSEPKAKITQVSLAAITTPPMAGMAIRVTCQTNEFNATALYIAAQNDSRAVARLLVLRGADPTHTAVGGRTPVAVAVHRGHPEIAAVIRDAVAEREGRKN